MSKSAIITGASSGIGKEFSYQLADQGYNLVINSRSEETLQEIANDIQTKYNVDVNVFVGDLSNSEDLEALCKLMQEVDHLSLLVNNAGFGVPQKFMEVEYEKHQSMIDVHVTAVTRLTYCAIEIYQQNGGIGDIITVASVASYIGSGMYSGTKHFQLSLMKRVSKQLKNTDIRLQTLCPGYTTTNFHYTDDFENVDVRDNTPKFLWMTPEFVVKESLKNLKKNKSVVIPSWKYKFIVFLAKLGIIRR